MKRSIGVAVMMVVALAMFAPAAEAGGYVGASISQTKVSIDTTGFDEDDTGWKAFGGFNFIKFFGLEAGYYDMGEPADGLASVDLTAWALSARGILPLGKHVELFAKLGYMAWDAEISGGIDDDDFDVTYGAGISVIFGEHFEIRGEYEILDADDSDVDLISLGAAFRFHEGPGEDRLS